MNTTLSTSSLLIHSFGWTLVYSLWQGLLLYGTLSIALRLMPNANARSKYYVSSAAMLGLFGWFAGTWYGQWQRLKGVTVYVTQQGNGLLSGKTYAIHTMPQEPVHNAWLFGILHGIETYMPYIVSIYVAGLLFMTLRFMLNLWQVTRLRTQGITPAEQEWKDYVAHWKKQFNVLRPVALYLSDRVAMPMMMGVIKPVILLPIATINHLSTEQLEAILLHELAHIKRHDYLLNILQTVVETILFFNPFAWLISSLIRREREHCCDDLVVAHTYTPLPYAHALAMLETNRKHVLAMAATGRKQYLFNRIKRIMEMKKNSVNYSQLVLIVLGVAAIMIAVACFSPTFAQKTKTDGKDTTGKKNTSIYTETYTTDKDGNTKKEVTKEIQNDNADDKDEANMDMAFGDGDSLNISKIIKMSMRIADSAIKAVDWKEIDKDMAAAREEMKDAQKEIADVDWDKVSKEIADAKVEVEKMNTPEFKKQMQQYHKDFDAAALQKTLDADMAIAKQEMAQAGIEIKEAQKEQQAALAEMPEAPEAPAPVASPRPAPHVDKINVDAGAMKKGTISIHATSATRVHNSDGTSFDDVLNNMQKDGLIDRSKEVVIAAKGGIMYINGKKQSASVYNKYSAYIPSEGSVAVGQDGGLTTTLGTK